MVEQTVEGDVGPASVTVEIESDDEQLANRLYADLVGDLERIRQIVEDGVDPTEAEGHMSADWTSYGDDE